jgi:group I intron endonuclease
MYKKISGIYAIVNMVNWKKYVGQAIDMKSRNSKELSELRNNKFHNQHLQHAWNKHGEENFVFIFLEECIEEKLDEREIYHVNAAGWPNHDLCYNLNEGGKSGGRQHPESNKKRSETLKGIETWNKGKKCPNISKANKGREPWNKGKKCHQLAGENNGMYGLTGEDHPMGGKTAWNKGKNGVKKVEVNNQKLLKVKITLILT